MTTELKSQEKSAYMAEAYAEAEKAYKEGEVPVGCVIVKDGKIIARAHNTVERDGSVLSHAEIKAIKTAEEKVGKYLDGCDMFVTVEPCAMCAGAIANARISKVYFGAYEKKGGGAVSKFNILSESGLNHVTEWEGGVLEEECSAVIKNFFSSRRKKSE